MKELFADMRRGSGAVVLAAAAGNQYAADREERAVYVGAFCKGCRAQLTPMPTRTSRSKSWLPTWVTKSNGSVLVVNVRTPRQRTWTTTLLLAERSFVPRPTKTPAPKVPAEYFQGQETTRRLDRSKGRPVTRRVSWHHNAILEPQTLSRVGVEVEL